MKYSEWKTNGAMAQPKHYTSSFLLLSHPNGHITRVFHTKILTSFAYYLLYAGFLCGFPEDGGDALL